MLKEDTEPRRALFDDLKEIPSVDLWDIQFGSRDWFWMANFLRAGAQLVIEL